MIIIWDRVPNGSVVKWDDGKEQLIVVRPAMDPVPGQYPIEILITEYEHIQFIEVYANPGEAIAFVNEEFSDANLKEKAQNLIADAIRNRTKPDVTGSLIQKHTYPMTDMR